MRVVIRADASRVIGSGHVMRCLTLADGLRERGDEVLFVSQEAPGDLRYLIQQRGFELIPPLKKGGGWDWLIIDHYELGLEYESSMRYHAKKIMAIDDLNREHDADILIRPTYGYALMSPWYAELRKRVQARVGIPTKILISFGASNVDRQTQIAEEITREVLGPEIQILAYDSKNRVPSLAPAILWADLAIGAGGITTWERCCLGLPSLVVTIAENQVPAIRELHQQELLQWVGGLGGDADWAANLRTALKRIAKEGLDPGWSQRCMGLVDGKGLERVLDLLC